MLFEIREYLSGETAVESGSCGNLVLAHQIDVIKLVFKNRLVARTFLQLGTLSHWKPAIAKRREAVDNPDRQCGRVGNIFLRRVYVEDQYSLMANPTSDTTTL